MNTHGVLSFRSEYLVYTPQALPFNSSVPLILLFWMDTNIINGGNIYYRNVADMETLRQAHALLIHNYTSGFYPTSVFIATWSEVPPNAPGLERQNNTYQTVLMTDGETSYVCFIFEEIQWGGGAGVGFNAGDGNRSLTVPGALTSETLELGNHSNIGRPGVFIYRVDGTYFNHKSWDCIVHKGIQADINPRLSDAKVNSNINYLRVVLTCLHSVR